MINKKEQKDQALFDRIAWQYARKDLIRSSAISRKRLLLNAVQPLLGQMKSLGVILDIGCGVGAPAKYLQGYYRKYIGIDQSEKMIEAARIFNQGNPRTEFIAGNIKTLKLSGDPADVILSIGALHHMTELDLVMESLCRLARPKGFILAIEPQNANPLIRVMRRVRVWVDKSYSQDQIFFSRDELIDLFQRNGVRNLSFDYLGYFSTPLAEVVLYPQFFFSPLSRMTAGFDSWLINHLPGKLRKFSFKISYSAKPNSSNLSLFRPRSRSWGIVTPARRGRPRLRERFESGRGPAGPGRRRSPRTSSGCVGGSVRLPTKLLCCLFLRASSGEVLDPADRGNSDLAARTVSHSPLRSAGMYGIMPFSKAIS